MCKECKAPDGRVATLRLITCGGSFDRATRSYRDNVVALARFARFAREPAAPGAAHLMP